MPQSNQDLGVLLQGIGRTKVSVGALPTVEICQDLLPTKEGLLSIGWEAGSRQVAGTSEGFMSGNLFYPSPRGWATTPEGTYFIKDDALFLLSDGVVTVLGPLIPCTTIMGHKGCIAVLNPYGMGGLLIYPPNKLPLATPRVGGFEMLGKGVNGMANTYGCIWLGSGGMGLLRGAVLQQTYLTLFFDGGIQALNTIYDFNNDMGTYGCRAAAGGFGRAFFLGKDGNLFVIAQTKVEFLGYHWLFRDRDISMQYIDSKSLLVLRDKTSGETWLFSNGLMKLSKPTVASGFDYGLGLIWFLQEDGQFFYLRDTPGYVGDPILGTGSFSLGVPGVKKFAALGLVASQTIPFDIIQTVDGVSCMVRQDSVDNLVPIDREGYTLALRIIPVGIDSGELVQSALLLFSPLDRRLLTDVVSNG